MFNKILIANRGEIAIRIMRACRELGIKTVAVYSEADRSALHAQIADEAVCIGPAASKDSYLNTKAIIAACEITHAQAIHPGFGFLSENADFARLCRTCGITFIGPSPEVMDAMGDKASAKQTMISAGVPVVPGSDGIVPTIEEARKVAAEIGYPVMIKATAGGGGRGIRLAESEEHLEQQYLAAQQEALACFGNGDVYIEKFIVNPRHVEIQLLADNHGNVVHLGERECSLQRHNQKVLEESPSPIMTPELREKMGTAAVAAAKVSGYQNAGTIEFLVDKDRNFYFMEMNTRIQVEHPVTIECRINAEDPRHNFRPCPGKIKSLHVPGGFGVRIDSAVYAGYQIPPYYDSMIAKLLVKAPTRDEAIKKMRVALSEFIIEGVETNIDFQLCLLKDEDFEAGNFDIGFLNRKNVMGE